MFVSFYFYSYYIFFCSCVVLTVAHFAGVAYHAFRRIKLHDYNEIPLPNARLQRKRNSTIASELYNLIRLLSDWPSPCLHIFVLGVLQGKGEMTTYWLIGMKQASHSE